MPTRIKASVIRLLCATTLTIGAIAMEESTEKDEDRSGQPSDATTILGEEARDNSPTEVMMFGGDWSIELKRAIKAAQRSITVVVDQFTSRDYAFLLAERASEGIAVKVIVGTPVSTQIQKILLGGEAATTAEPQEGETQGRSEQRKPKGRNKKWTTLETVTQPVEMKPRSEIKGKNGVLYSEYGREHLEKMHSKFIIIDNSVLYTGSPNLSDGAARKNSELVVRLKGRDHLPAVQVYEAYAEYISARIKYNSAAAGTELEASRELRVASSKVTRRIEINREQGEAHPQVCVTPMCPLGKFVGQRLPMDGGNVIIGEFLLGYTKNELDIVHQIVDRCRDQDKLMQVPAVYYDQAAATQYRQISGPALNDLETHCKASLIPASPKGEGGVFHDKGIAIDYGETARRDRYATIVGSFGFTEGSQSEEVANQNMENGVWIPGEVFYKAVVNKWESQAKGGTREGRGGGRARSAEPGGSASHGAAYTKRSPGGRVGSNRGNGRGY